MPTIDNLNVEIKSTAGSANKTLGTFSDKLQKLSDVLNGMETGKFTDLANGINSLGNAMKTLQGVKTTDFNKLAKGITSIGSVDIAKINSAAEGIKKLGDAFGKMPQVPNSSKQIGDLASSISKLGYKNIGEATKNLPQLTKELTNLMNELSKAPAVSKNTIALTNALGNLSKNGAKVGSAANGFKQFYGNASSGGNLLSNSLIKLGSNLSSSNSRFSKFGGILTKTGVALSDFGTKTSAVKNPLTQLASTVGKLYATFWILQRAVSGLWGAIEKGADWLETFNLFENVFSSVGADHSSEFSEAGYKDAETYANSFEERAKARITEMSGFEIDNNGGLKDTGVKSLGLDPDMLANYSARFLNIANSMGVTGETAYKTSDALTRLGADMSSLFNTDLSTTYDDLTSGLTGQARVLDKYGINIRNANLQTIAYQYGLSGAVSSMDQATKEQLRMIAILQMSKPAWGDMAGTINLPANQLRLLRQNLASVARTIGSLFLPMIAAVLPYLNALAIVIQRALAWIGKITGLSTKATKLGSGLKSSGSDLSDLYDNVDSAAQSAGDSAKSAGNKAEKASKKINKLQRSLMGFDKINKLNEKTDTSTGSTGGTGTGSGGSVGGVGGVGGADLSGAIDDLLEQYDKAWNDAMNSMNNKAQQIAAKLTEYAKKGDWKGMGAWIGGAIADRLNKIPWNSIYKAMQNFGIGLAQFLNGLISPNLFSAVGKTIAGSLNTAINLAFGFSSNFDFKNLGTSIANGINGFFKEFDAKKLGKSVHNFIQGIFTVLTQTVKETDWNLVFTRIGEFLGELDLGDIAFTIAGVALSKTSITKLPGMITKAFEVIGVSKLFSGVPSILASGFVSIMPSAFTAFKSLGAISKIGSLLLTVFKNAIPVLIIGLGALSLAKIAPPILEALISAIEKVDWVNLGQKIGKKLTKALGDIEWGRLIKDIIKFAIAAIKAIGGLALGFIDALVGAFLGTKGTFSQEFTKNMKREAKNFKKAGKELINGIKKGFKSALKGIKSWILKHIFKEITVSAKSSSKNDKDAKKAGENVGDSILDGIAQQFKDIGKWIKENVFDKIGEAIENLGEDVDAAIKIGIQLFKDGWESIKEFIGFVEDKIEVGLQLIKDGWQSLKEFVGEKVEAGLKLLKDGWASLKEFVGEKVEAGLKLFKDGWTSLKEFVGEKVEAGLKLLKDGWTSLKEFVGEKVAALVSLAKDGWTSLKNFVGEKVTALVSLAKDGWKSLQDFGGTVYAYVQRKSIAGIKAISEWGGNVYAYVKRTSASGIKAISDWGGTVYAYVKRTSASGIKKISEWGGTVTASVKRSLAKGQKSLQKAFGGVISVGIKFTGKMWNKAKKIFGLETGGIYKGGRWQPIQGYASGGSPQSSRLFYANENGMPELVGRIGSNTAVMNNGQIVASVASGVYQAVVVAFSQLRSYFASMTSALSRLPAALGNQSYVAMGNLQRDYSYGYSSQKVSLDQETVTSVEQAVERGVYKAVSVALAGKDNTNVTVQLVGDAKGLFKAIRKEANNYTHSTGKPAFDL